ncbi:MAG: hypothetical protein CM1200mP14_16360 [Gammaproteobacteria bacterium]|nr:MAG: hypothetical protein CM1200mP14_16360 [Gammaproteobacteria bacterium]
MGIILGDFICPDCGYRTAVRSELAKDVDIKAYMESREAEGSSIRDMVLESPLSKALPCPQCGSTTGSENDQAKMKRWTKRAGWIVLGIVIFVLAYYLDLLKFTWGG